MSQIDEIKSRIDIVDLVAETVKLRRAGKNFSGLCPFHNEKTPSFIVSPDRQTWHCFGQCGEGGDIFRFMMKKEGWDFKETLRYLAERAGVKLEAYKAQKPEEKEAHERLHTLLEEVVTFYRYHLSIPAGKFALDYIHEKRHLADTTIETFGLGYAPQGWDIALNRFKDQGYTDQELLDVGLTSERESGGFIDRFRNRLMIPIRDENGKMAGFGARILDPNDVPKFINSPETPLFSKSHLLYGLDRARKPIRAANQAIIVEGYLDVIALHQAGFENVVSPMGTSLTEDQLRLLKRFTGNIVLALDPDAAGQKAVLRGLEAARQSLDRQDEIGFDARGLLHHEARLQADLRVATMPDGLDPDEIVQRDPEQWRKLIENAQPIVVHVMGALSLGRDLDDAKVKSEIASRMLPLIEDLPNPVERDTYRQRLARFLKVDERSISSWQSQSTKVRRPRLRVDAPAIQQEVPPSTTPKYSPSHKGEAHILSLLIRRPDLLYRLDRGLLEAGMVRMAAEDFSYTDHQLLFRLVRQSLEQDIHDASDYLRQNLPLMLESLVDELAAKPGELDPVDDRLLEDLFRAVMRIRRTALTENINQLRFLQEDSQQSGDLRTESYRDMVQQYSTHLRILDQAQLKQNGRRKEGQ
jgi:DNA primase